MVRKEWNIFKSIISDYKIECTIIFIIGLVFMLGFEYVDGISFMAYSIEIWDALFSGRILELPQVLVENVRQAPHAGLNMGGGALIFLPWSIWNFPIWLTHTFPNVSDVLTPLCLIWTKLFLYIVTIAVGLECYHVVNYMTHDEKNSKLAALMVWGSSTAWICSGYSMQDEMEYIFTFLLALLCYFNNKKFFCIFWLTITTFLSPYMLLISLILILHMEKNLFRIIFDCIIMVFPYALISISMPIILESHDNYLEWFVNRTVLNTGISTISVFIIIMVVLYALSYFQKYDSTQKSHANMLYYMAIASTAMCLLSWVHFYRYIICFPFLVIAFFVQKRRKESFTQGFIVICSIFEIMRFVGAIFFDQNFLAPVYVSRIVKKFITIDSYSFVELLQRLFNISQFTIDVMPLLFGSIIFASAIIILWMIRTQKEDINSIIHKTSILTKIYVSLPLFVLIPFFIILFSVIHISSGINVNSELAQPITNEIVFSTECSLNSSKILSVSVQPVTWDRDYPDDVKLCLDIIDCTDNKVLSTYEVLADDLPNNAEYIFDTSNVKISKDHIYNFKIYAQGTMNSEEDYIYLLKSNDNFENKNLSLKILNTVQNVEDNVSYQIISNLLCIR